MVVTAGSVDGYGRQCIANVFRLPRWSAPFVAMDHAQARAEHECKRCELIAGTTGE